MYKKTNKPRGRPKKPKQPRETKFPKDIPRCTDVGKKCKFTVLKMSTAEWKIWNKTKNLDEAPLQCEHCGLMPAKKARGIRW